MGPTASSAGRALCPETDGSTASCLHPPRLAYVFYLAVLNLHLLTKLVSLSKVLPQTLGADPITY